MNIEEIKRGIESEAYWCNNEVFSPGGQAALDWLIAEVERLELELAETNADITHLNQMSFGL